nr:ParA family protein [Ktedonobacteraceae bacterium]
AVRMDRPVKAYDRWIARIPDEYRNYVLDEPGKSNTSVTNDSNCLALLKHYRSLMPLAQEAHKPIFHLKPADGAMGSHMQAVQSAYADFNILAKKIGKKANFSI